MASLLRAGVLAAISLLSMTAPARAANEFDASGVEPPIDPYGYVRVSGSRTLEPLQPHASLTYDWTNRPLSFDLRRFGLARDFNYNDEVSTAALAVGCGLYKLPTGNVEAGLALPIVLERVGLDRHDGHRTHEGGLGGDLRVDAKATLLDADEGIFGGAGRIWMFAPTAAEGRFIGADDSFRAGFEAILEVKIDWFRAGLTLGWEWLDGRFEGPSGTVDDRFIVGLGLAIAPLRDIAGFEPLEVCFELRHWTVATRPWDHESLSPFEAMGAVRYGGTVFGLLGAGGGLNRGLGAPDARIEAAIGFTY